MMRLARRVPEFGVPHRPVGLAALYDVADDWVPIYDKSTCPASSWRAARAATSSRTRRSPGMFMAAIIDADAAARPRRRAGAGGRAAAPAAPSTSARSPAAGRRQSPAAP